ncbi:hypothetical protein XELAEV_18026062mg [Xenopus laevis]|uniref:Uncharacterized protein n=1 Tax=Xenopus laevis TaxID=8355 RepID=A0A974CV23_XENLA|nr:hypothetical protein XELAEV_18026062mg [Xenopus laevis]
MFWSLTCCLKPNVCGVCRPVSMHFISKDHDIIEYLFKKVVILEWYWSAFIVPSGFCKGILLILQLETTLTLRYYVYGM